jgi:hypothetical protein
MTQEFKFEPAERSQSLLRLGLIGPPGSGKTLTGLKLLHGIAGDAPIAVIDTEHGRSQLYAHIVPHHRIDLETFAPRTYVAAIRAARQQGFEHLLIDSLSHAWEGTDGAREQVDRAKQRYGGNQWAAWADVTPMHRDMIEAMLAFPGHLVVTMRSKVEWAEQSDGQRKTYVRIGTAAVQREGLEYEFDLVADIDMGHQMIVSKSRFPDFDGRSFTEPDEAVGEALLATLREGKPLPPAPPDPEMALNAFGVELDARNLRDSLALVWQGRGTPNRRAVIEWLESLGWDVDAAVSAVEVAHRERQAEQEAEPQPEPQEAGPQDEQSTQPPTSKRQRRTRAGATTAEESPGAAAAAALGATDEGGE